MVALLIKNFIRSKGLLVGLAILFISGIISLNIGKQFLEKNEKIIQKTSHFQKENIDRYVQYMNKEMGLLLYYVRFGLVNETPNIVGLSIGQRDINPSLHNVTIRNLEEQKYTTDLMNPMYQLIGNMDLSFVIIYFFPLIIIAFGFNLVSEEKEEGTWSLVLSQTANTQKMLRLKAGVRYVSILSVLFLLLLIAKFYLSIPFDIYFTVYILTAFFYISFWFSLVWLVVSFHKNSSQNALILLTSWITLTIIVPALMNALVIQLYPIPEAFSTVLDSRDGYHSQWDKAKEPTIEKFHQLYPQLVKYNHPKDKDFSWLWYYAMQQMGDETAVASSKKLKEKIKQRENLSKKLGLWVPTIHTQLTMNTLCFSDITNYLAFIEALERFHEQKRMYFYPKIFSDTPVSSEKWDTFSLAYFKNQPVINLYMVLLPYLIISTLCLLWANINFNRKKYNL
ncbi:MAG: DUF3526 domain-containing protein [Raineya sp.]|jgi:ABC-2 type transport system permease protein|nr:DUF3526 domain-containing protein [Raineya sp.]